MGQKQRNVMQNERVSEKTKSCETKLVLVAHLTHITYYIKSSNDIPSISLHWSLEQMGCFAKNYHNFCRLSYNNVSEYILLYEMFYHEKIKHTNLILSCYSFEMNYHCSRLYYLMVFIFVHRHVIWESMSAGISAEHAGARGTGSAQPFAACVFLLLKEVFPQQPAEENQVSHKAGERTSFGGSAHTSHQSCFTDIKVMMILL